MSRDDTISRQAAIELIKNYCENGCDLAEDNWCPSCQREQFVKLLKDLPSAQPEQENYTELKRELLRTALYVDALLECSDEQKKILIGFISRLIELILYPIRTFEEFPIIETQHKKGKWVNIDDIYRLIAGHSNYHGDNILSALTCLAEGKKVSKPIRVLDTERTGDLSSAQSQYEELTPEEAASEIASGSTMSAWYWLDDLIRLKQMGYVICRKR